MKRGFWVFAVTMLLALAGNLPADENPAPAPVPAPAPQTSSVGGGVKNPWRPPYRTAAVTPVTVLPN